MKVRRIVAWGLILILIIGSVFTVIYTKNLLESKILTALDIQESNQDVSWSKIRTFNENGKRGIQVAELSVINSQSGDSLFYAQKVILFTEDKISTFNDLAQIAIFVDSPIIHLHETTESNVDTDMSEELGSFSFQDMPSLYIYNLSIVNYNTDSLPTRIDGIYLKAVQNDKAWHINLRYKTKNQNFFTSAQLRGNTSKFKIDSALLEIQGIRVCHFEYEHNHFKRDKDNYKLHIFNQLLASEMNQFDRMIGSSFVDFNYHIASHDGAKSISGYCDAHINIPDSLILNFTHKINQNQTSNHSLADLDLISSSGSIDWEYLLNSESERFNFSQRFISDFQTEIQIGDNQLSFQSDGNFKSEANTYGEMLSVGEFKNQLNAIYDDIDYEIIIEGNGNQTVLNVLSSQLNLDAKLHFNEFKKSMHFDSGLNIDGVIHFSELRLPEKGQVPSKNSMMRLDDDKFVLPEVFKKSNIRLSVLIDTLRQDSTILSVQNDFFCQYQNEAIQLKGSINFMNQYSGKLQTNIDFSNGNLSGILFSDSVKIHNTSNLPLVASNIDFTKDTATLYAFEIPFQSKADELIVPKSVLRSDEFLLMLSGEMTIDDQHFELGLSAPSGQFKGAAALLINAKTTGKSSGLQTLILKVNRNQGKLNIKTEVREN